jgi:hypothetical protein
MVDRSTVKSAAPDNSAAPASGKSTTEKTAAEVALVYNAGVPRTDFAAGDIKAALNAQGVTWVQANLDGLSAMPQKVRIVLASSSEYARQPKADPTISGPRSSNGQAYCISKKVSNEQTSYIVIGAAASGVMYGGLDVAEAIRTGALAQLQEGQHVPYVEKRGIKFNLPLDARTPSYSDAGDSAQHNIPEIWDEAFWHEFIDEMARHRFNVLTLWNLHPFPSLVKVPEYPDVALDDVMRTTEKFDSSFSLNGTDMVRPNILAHLETVKKLAIEDKIRFWRHIMQYAHDRGIEVYLFTWNIFVWGVEGKYGITHSQTNETTIDYFRKSVKETLLTYPLLAGIGITAGENMEKLKGEYSDERWLWKTYGEGIRDVKNLHPERPIRLIHRFHWAVLDEVLDAWKEYPDTFEFSYKYSVAHMYSSTRPPFLEEVLNDLAPQQRIWLTVRNDDIYNLQWGDPTFAREYVRNMPGPDRLTGYYMGPDGYIWGREFVSTESESTESDNTKPDSPRQQMIVKQWYSFMMWGRLSYDPTLPDALFERALATRFPELPSATLFQAMTRSSRIIPLVNRAYWNDIDLRWYPEGCCSHPVSRLSKGFHTVRHFAEGQSMPASGILSITQYRDTLLDGRTMDGMTPSQVADELAAHAQATLELLDSMEVPPVSRKELRFTLGDLRAMAYLGLYYAEKFRAATDLSLFDKSAQSDQQQSAVRHLESALDSWKQYAAIATRQYNPQLFTRVGYVDLNELTEKVQDDIAIAQNWQPQTT